MNRIYAAINQEYNENSSLLRQAYVGRSNTSSFGFNGMEMDNEIFGSTGTHLDFGARVYDSRIGRFLSTDTWSYKYPWQTSYAYHRNSPVWKIAGGQISNSCAGLDEVSSWSAAEIPCC
jgi:RHS repeat-associated protein